MTGVAPQIDLKLQFSMEPWKSTRYPKIKWRARREAKSVH